jgi:L-threonylcarbamoyladenylate synthase
VVTRIGTDIAHAAELLVKGQVVSVPTETVYGLAACALNPDAVALIFQVKKRPAFDPLIVHCQNSAHAFSYAESIPEDAHRLAAAFWPGPLTLVLPKQETIPGIVSSGLPTVALRVPAHPVMQNLLAAVSFPLAAPSANLFGRTSPTQAAHVMAQLGGHIPYVLDGGPCSVGLESTIVGFHNQQPIIYRLGGISTEAIAAVCPNVGLTLHQSDNPVAPGMLTAHYASRKPTFFGDAFQIGSHINHFSYALISLFETDLSAGARLNLALSPSGNLVEAATRFFDALHVADASDAEIILIEEFPDEGLGRALNDRARRAAAGHQAD